MDRVWTRTPSSLPRATGAAWSRWSGTSVCSTRTANRSPRAIALAAQGLRFLGFDARPSLIVYMAKQSKRMAKRIAEEMR